MAEPKLSVFLIGHNPAAPKRYRCLICQEFGTCATSTYETIRRLRRNKRWVIVFCTLCYVEFNPSLSGLDLARPASDLENLYDLEHR